jgi:glycosyltransferase involved in cell wall biosynthesis
VVSSSNSEGLPLSFLEAMACGVPIAATANEGSSMLIRETGTGLLSPVGDARALAASIVTLLNDPAKSAVLAQHGRSAVVQKFSLEKTLSEYRDLYEAVLR